MTPEAIAEERAMTLQAATGELVSWDRYERELLTHLERRIVDPKLLAIVSRRRALRCELAAAEAGRGITDFDFIS